MSKPKILIFSLAYYPKHVGGAEVAIKEITDRIGDAYEFHLVCNRYDSTLPKTDQVGNIKVHRIGFVTKNPSMKDLRKFPLHLNKIWFQFAAFWAARKLHQKYNFSAIWAMMGHSTGVPAAKFKAAFPDVKYVLTLQEGDPPEYIEKKMRVFGQAFDRAFTTADTIQVISTFLGNWATKKGFTGSLIRVPNAVNAEHFAQEYNETEIAAARQELGLSDDDVAVVTTSRLVHKNGVDDVIRAMSHLPQRVKFIIFGTGPDEQKLRMLANELHVADRIVFYGFIDHAVMPKYLKACQIFARPSRSEGMGNSFVEAMAARLPVIATQEGGISDFLFDATRNPKKDATGWAVDTNAPEQIAAAVMDILDNPDTVLSVTETAYQMARAEYDWNLIARRMQEEIFTPLLNCNEK